jgi:predicted RNA binding protein YcfA (HicA-like mRNA interferase family)
MARGLATRIADLKRRRRSVTPHDMDKLLVDAGFTRRHGKGDHWVYSHPQRPFPLTIDPRKSPVAGVRVEGDRRDRGGDE